MNQILELLLKALSKVNIDITVFAIGCATGWYAYHNSSNLVAVSVDVFCVVWLSCSLIVKIRKYVLSKLTQIKEKYEYKQEVENQTRQLVAQAQDIFEQLTDRERRNLCYAILAGVKSHQYNNVYYYKINTYTCMVNELQSACKIPGTYNSVVDISFDNGKVTLYFLNPQLIGVTKKYIENQGINKSNIEAEIDKEIEKSKTRYQ